MLFSKSAQLSHYAAILNGILAHVIIKLHLVLHMQSSTRLLLVQLLFLNFTQMHVITNANYYSGTIMHITVPYIRT